MQFVTLHNRNRPQVSPVQAKYCASFFCRLRGLTFRSSLPANQGLLLVEARDSRLDAAIHMLFVWMDLAVIWINAAGEVVDTRLARQWRPAYMPRRPARYILELAAERLDDFRIGEIVEFEEISRA
jgi:uncharacterized membrane protein (UPF0127 family)